MTDTEVIAAIIERIASHAYQTGRCKALWPDYLEHCFPGIADDQVERCMKEANRLYVKTWGRATHDDASDRNDH